MRKLLREAPLDVEAVDYKGRVVAAGRIDLAAALDGDQCRGFSDKAPKAWRRLSAQRREADFELRRSGDRKLVLTTRVVAGRADDARSPSSESPYSEEDSQAFRPRRNTTTYPKVVCAAGTWLRYQEDVGGTRRHRGKDLIDRLREDHRRNLQETVSLLRRAPTRVGRACPTQTRCPVPARRRAARVGGLEARRRAGLGRRGCGTGSAHSSRRAGG